MNFAMTKYISSEICFHEKMGKITAVCNEMLVLPVNICEIDFQL